MSDVTPGPAPAPLMVTSPVTVVEPPKFTVRVFAVPADGVELQAPVMFKLPLNVYARFTVIVGEKVRL